MKRKLRWLLLIVPLALFAWAWQAASWRPKLVGVQDGHLGVPPSSGRVLIKPPEGQLLLSPDGKRLICYWYWAANSQSLLALWSLESREKVWQQHADGHALSPLAFSPDGRSLAVAGETFPFGRPSFTVDIIDAATGTQRREIVSRWQSHLQSAAFLSNGALVVATSQGAVVVDTQTGKMIRQWKFKSLAFETTKRPAPHQSHISADGTTTLSLSTGPRDTTIVLYDPHTGKLRATWTYKGIFRNPRLSPDGTLWAMSGNKFDLLSIYDARTGQKLWGSFAGNETTAPWAWSADSRRLAFTDNQGVWFFAARQQNFLGRVSGARGNQALALSPDGDFLCTLDSQGKIWRWRAR